MFNITVPVNFAVYQNAEHPQVAAIAKKYNVKYNGGGMFLGGGVYDHVYLTDDRAAAMAFVTEVTALGINVRIVE